jgi:hypothetical protein
MSVDRLVAADEFFDHPVADDPSWTEKVCAMAAPRDGSIQAAFGMGKYPHRGVLDAYAGVSMGKQQWTVRSSTSANRVGPITYEVLEPLQVVRFALAENDVVPISFEWIFRGALPCAREEPSQFESGLTRYHQIGTAEGWIAVDGVRHELVDAVSTRDHSWGVRNLGPVTHRANVTSTVIWSPILMEGYGIHVFYQRHALGERGREELMGGIEHADGRREPFASLVPTYDVDDATRRLKSATLNCTMADGSARPLKVTALGDTGFHLGTGLYFGFDGHFHGEDRGALHVDGEHIADCTAVATAHRIHQIRDNLVRVEDPVGGGGVGVGNMQTIFSGPHPDAGLTEAASFM